MDRPRPEGEQPPTPEGAEGGQQKVPSCALSPEVAVIPQVGGIFEVKADCSGEPIRYRWTVNGELQPGTGSRISGEFPRNDTANERNYTIVLVATNGVGASLPASVSVKQVAAAVQKKVPVCTLLPEVAVIPHEGGIFSVSADCSGEPLSYTWRVRGELQPGTGYSISGEFPRNDTGSELSFEIVVMATNSVGIGAPESIVVKQAAAVPVCKIIPEVQKIPWIGGKFSVSADCTGNPTRYEWTVNNVLRPETGKTAGDYFPPNLTGQELDCTIVLVATNGVGDSLPVTLVVKQSTFAL